MNQNSSVSVLVTIIALIFIALGIWWWYSSSTPAPVPTPDLQEENMTSTDETAVQNIVTEFGGQLQMVPLMASTTALLGAIRNYYSQYVSPELLSMWLATPTSSPGRLTSSPSPDRIDIISITRNLNGSYAVRGRVVETTSMDSSTTTGANSYPVTLTVEQRNGAWVITEYEYERS